MVIRNDKMRDAFLELSKAVWQVLEDHRKEGHPLLTIERKKANWTEIGLIVTIHHESNMVEFLRRHMSEIRRMKEFETCIEVMREDEVVNGHLEKRVGYFTNTRLIQTPMIVEMFLIHFMSDSKSFDFDISSFIRVYQEMEDFFYMDMISVEVFVHLEGFSSTAEKLDFGNGWEISRIPKTQFDDLLSEGLLEDSPHMSKYALYWKLNTSKRVLENEEEFDSPGEYQNYENTVRKIVTALRLFKAGDIGFRRIIRRYKGWLSHEGSIHTSVMKHFWNPYRLELGELDNFRLLLDLILNAPDNSAFELALERLNDAVERQKSYDSLIDYMIAFEAIFLLKGDRKKTTLSKRTAIMITEKDSGFENIFRRMRLAYDLRNSIVHGDSREELNEILQKTGSSKREFVNEIGEYLRKSIKQYLVHISKGDSKKDIVRTLERSYSDIYDD